MTKAIPAMVNIDIILCNAWVYLGGKITVVNEDYLKCSLGAFVFYFLYIKYGTEKVGEAGW